ncbi:MAG: hypothetical protein Q9211_005227 [Gyalolechia sp. 1 TL-2023]
MYTSLGSFIVAALWVSGTLGAVPAVKQTYLRCDTTSPPVELVTEAKSMVMDSATIGSALATRAAINVRTYFHVVTSSSKVGRYTQTQLNDQLNYLNNAYSASTISFTLVSTDFTTNNNWATGNYDSEMKPALRKGTYADLNLYFLSDVPKNSCKFPTGNDVSPGSSALYNDGCKILADTVPGGSAIPFNLGGTAVHEVGHWFGLFHVFQGNSCSGPGDLVDDTPIQSTYTFGECPSSKDSCPDAPGLDDIHNYMDWSADVWYGYPLFTTSYSFLFESKLTISGTALHISPPVRH